MQTNVKLWATVVVVAIIALTGVFLPQGKTIVNEITKNLGATVGPELTNDYWSFDGFEQSMKPMKMATATSTVCAIRTPSASSTLVGFYANFWKPPTVATTFVLSTSTTGYSTSSPIYAGSLPANATNTIAWLATTTTAGLQNKTLVPNSFIVFDLQGSPSYSSLVGKCYAEFRAFK